MNKSKTSQEMNTSPSILEKIKQEKGDARWQLLSEISAKNVANETKDEKNKRFQMQFYLFPLPTYIWKIVGEDMILVDINQAAMDFSGSKIKSLLGHKAKDLYYDIPKVIDWMNQCRETTLGIRKQFYMKLRTTGELKYLDASWVFFPPDYILFHVSDISQQKKEQDDLEQKVEKTATDLKKSNDLLKSLNHMLEKEIKSHEKTEVLLKSEQKRVTFLMEHIPIIIFLINSDQTISYGNNYFKKYIGNYKNQYCFELMYCKDSKCQDCIVDKVLKTGLHQRIEWQSKTNEYFVMHFYPFKEIDRKKVVLGLGIDITERKKIEEELKKSKIKAEKSSLFKSQFLARMSHEIRTPMNGVIGITDILMNTNLSSKQKEYVSILKNSGKTLLTIINDILDISKIEAGKFELEIQPFNINASIDDVYKLLEPNANEKNIKFSYNIQENIHPYLKGDSTRIKQILFNLIANAIKFTQKGEVSIIVEHKDIDSETIGIQFDIKDTGIGIPEDQQRNIFKNFTQIDSEQKKDGTGLGLSICFQLVKIMNGKLWVSSEINKGSHFYFYLELSKANKSELTKKHSEKFEQRKNIYHKPQSSKKIMLVEDNDVNARVFTLLLKKFGFSCDSCTNGKEALELLNRKSYDIIFMDIMMPEMDGIQATQYIRNKLSVETQPIIVAVTADAMIGQRKKYINSGFDDYLSKPVTEKKLSEILKKYTDNSEPVKEQEIHNTKDIKKSDEENINLQHIKMLRQEMGSGYIEILQTYIDESPLVIKSLKKAINSNSYEEIRLFVHSLKSITNVFGENYLSKLCLEMEKAAMKKLKIDYNSNLKEILEAYDTFKDFVEDELVSNM